MFFLASPRSAPYAPGFLSAAVCAEVVVIQVSQSRSQSRMNRSGIHHTAAVKRNAHCHLELCRELRSGQVDTCNHLGGRMLDLEMRVELKEVERIISMAVEVYRANI